MIYKIEFDAYQLYDRIMDGVSFDVSVDLDDTWKDNPREFKYKLNVINIEANNNIESFLRKNRFNINTIKSEIFEYINKDSNLDEFFFEGINNDEYENIEKIFKSHSMKTTDI